MNTLSNSIEPLRVTEPNFSQIDTNTNKTSQPGLKKKNKRTF